MRRDEETGLITSARQGDTADFGGIVRRYQNLVSAPALQIP